MTKLGLEVAEVLVVLGDKIGVRVLPLRHCVHFSLVLGDLLQQLICCGDSEVLLDAESLQVDCWAWVDSVLQSQAVLAGEFEVSLEAVRLDQVRELCLRVVQVTDVSLQVRVIRLQQLRVEAEADQCADQMHLQTSNIVPTVVGLRLQIQNIKG